MMKTKTNNFPFLPGCNIVLTILLAAVGGCTTPDAAKQIKAFSDATALTADNTTQAFSLVEDGRLKEELSVSVLHYDKTNGFNPEDIKPFISTNALQVRIDILTALKTYAGKLSALMGNDSLTNFDQDTTKLGQALTNINSDVVKDSFFKTTPATPEEIQIFTTAVNALGHWLISRKEEKEAKAAIDSMQLPVAQICTLLQKDFDILGQQLSNDENNALRNYNQYILNNLRQFDENPETKRTEIQDLVALTQEIKANAALFASMKSSTQKLAAAHKALGEVFSNDTSNVRSLINELSAESQRISKYYNSLRSSK
jgi:hypothetical protein